MEKTLGNTSIYWMRKVTTLSKIRDILLLIEKRGGLRHTEIADIGIKEGIFIKKDGKPLAPTPIYHCIRATRKLGLITQDRNRKYIVNQNRPEACMLIKLNRYLVSLDREESLIFQKLIIGNSDCRNVFFWLFMGKRNFSWNNFVKYAEAVFVFPTIIKKQGEKARTKKYVNKKTGYQITLQTPLERIAIEWGLELWGEECYLIDEIYIDESKHVLYPLEQQTLKFDNFVKKFLQLYRPSPDSDWGFFPIDLVIFELAPLLRISVKEIQDRFFSIASQKLPNYIKFSSSSKGALTFRSLWQKTDKKVLRNFLKLNDVWVTHIMVHRKLWEVRQWKN